MTGTAARPSLGKRERNKADKYRRIVAAARDLFERQGFRDTTTAQISERAGVGTGTLYLYVSSKEELLLEVFRDEVGRAWDDAFDRVDRQRPLESQLLMLFGAVTDFHLLDPELARTYFKELSFLTVAGTTANDFMRKYHDRLTAVLVEAQHRGSLRPDVPVAVLSRNLFALWSHLMRRTFGGEIRPEQVHAELAASFSVALLGLQPPT
ncbi:MAG: TetR/AcrR family transcriptional regulator [Actinomycetota bacterium]